MDMEAEMLRSRIQIRGYISSITDLISFISKGCQQLLGKHKKCAVAVFFVMLEVISLVLDVFGKSQGKILLSAFLLSAFGFGITICSYMFKRTSMATRVQTEKQLGAVEFVFSVVQLIATFLAVLGIRVINNYTTSILLLFFAVIVAGFTFKKDEQSSCSSRLENNVSSLELSQIVCIPDETGGHLLTASSPNQIDEHSDVASTHNEIQNIGILQALLMRAMNIWILRGLIMRLLMNIGIVQVVLLMRLMSNLILQALIMRLMSILILQALVMRLMSILILQSLQTRMMNIWILQTLQMRMTSIWVLQVLQMRLMSIHLCIAISTQNEIVEHLDIASTPNKIDKHSDIASTPNKIDKHSDIASTSEIEAIKEFNIVDDHVNRSTLASYMEMEDGEGNEWLSRFVQRHEKYEKQLLSGGWLDCVTRKHLEIGDEAEFFKEEERVAGEVKKNIKLKHT